MRLKLYDQWEMNAKYKVKTLSQLAGVSVKTLHYYDEIGLLMPAYQGANGYRYYGEGELLRLQQILFFKEVGCTLKQIKTFLTQKGFNQIDSLHFHRKSLVKERERISQLIQTVDQTLQHLTGDKPMSITKLFKGFSRNTTKEEFERIERFTKEDWIAYSNELNASLRQMADLLKRGLAFDHPETQNATLTFYEVLKKTSDLDRDAFIALSKTYVKEEMRFFFKEFDPDHPKLANYLSQAMSCFAMRNLIPHHDSARKLRQIEEHDSFTTDFASSLAMTENWKGSDWEKQTSGLKEILDRLAQHFHESIPADSTEVQKTIQSYFEWMKKLQPIDKVAFLKLAEQYLDPSCQALFEPHSDNPSDLARYVSEGMKIFAQKV